MELKAYKVLPEYKVLKVLKVLPEYKVHKVLLEHKVLKVK